MTELIYITHPEVIIDADIDIDSWQISSLGWDRIQNLLLLDFWHIVEKVYTSTEPKAYAIAEEIKKEKGIGFEKIHDFREIDRSSTGMITPISKYMQVVRSSYENPLSQIKGWESLNSVMLRNSKIVEKLKVKHLRKTIVIIGHGCAGTTIKCHIKKISPSFQEDPQRTGCYFVADLETNTIINDWKTY